MAKLIKREQKKVSQAKTKITEVQEGFEGGTYTIEKEKASYQIPSINMVVLNKSLYCYLNISYSRPTGCCLTI